MSNKPVFPQKLTKGKFPYAAKCEMCITICKLLRNIRIAVHTD